MKLSYSKNNNSQNSKHSPFFQKENGDIFFGKTSNSFFNLPSIQAKLAVNQPNDKYEQEADAMADKVVQRLTISEPLRKKDTGVQAKSFVSGITPLIQRKCTACEKENKLQKKEEGDLVPESPLGLQRKPIFESKEPPDDENIVQRKCAECEQEDELKLQTKNGNNSTQVASSSLESNLSSSKGSGSPLPKNTRTQMESSFGVDFSNVRLHDDDSAVQMSKNLNAEAFTHGNDIYFNAGKCDTNSAKGKHLLAHELTHTLQQGETTGLQPFFKRIQRKEHTFIQRSAFSDTVDKLWQANPNREALLERLSHDDAFDSRADGDLQRSLAKMLIDPNDLWLAQKVLTRQLGESTGKFKGKSITLPIELFFFKGISAEKALVIAGVHGSEQQGMEVARMLKTDLTKQQPYFNVVLVPSLFPVNAKNRIRELDGEANMTNRNFPAKGTQLKDAKKDRAGNPIDADNDRIVVENQLLIQLIERFQPSRIISIHGTQYASEAGVFSDPITSQTDHGAFRKQAADLANYMLTQIHEGDPRNIDPNELQKLTALLVSYMIAEHNRAQTQRDVDLSIKAAMAITDDTSDNESLKNRHKSGEIVRLIKKKFKKDPKAFDAAKKRLEQNAVVAGNRLGQPDQNAGWSGDTPEGESLGEYAPSFGISVFTVEPAINQESGRYPMDQDKGVRKADREAELQAYATAIRTILLGK